MAGLRGLFLISGIPLSTPHPNLEPRHGAGVHAEAGAGGVQLPGVHRGRQLGGAQVHSETREFFVDNLLLQIHSIIEMIWGTGLAPWTLEFPFPGSLISTFLTPKPCGVFP